MPRHLTSRNYEHPHYQLKTFVQKTKEVYRKATTLELSIICEQVFASITDAEKQKLPELRHRHQMMNWLLERAEIDFKAAWEKRCGFPFSDVYDKEKMAGHLARIANEEHKKKQQQEESSNAEPAKADVETAVT